MKQIRHLWELKIKVESLKAAIDLCGRENMVAKVEARRDNKRVAIRRSLGRIFSERNSSCILKLIETRLRYNFDCNY